MESSTPPMATSNSNSGGIEAQDPLALPNEHHVGYSTENNGQDQPSTTTTQSNTNNSNSDKNLSDGSMTTNTNSNNGAIYSNNDPGMQYSYNDVRQLNHHHQQHMSMPPHETHKTFSHSIENLSKTTEKCPSNDMKM